MLRYAITNLINDDDTDLYPCSEDMLYIVENLYNVRPSLPYRTEGIGTTAGCIPEDVCIEFATAVRPTLVAIFNHLFELEAGGDELYLKACLGGCPYQSGACNWNLPPGAGGPDYRLDLSDRLLENHKNLYKIFDAGAAYNYWQLSMIDSGVGRLYLELGELFLGTVETLSNAYLQPKMAAGPTFFENVNITQYGQIWSNYFGEAKEFSLEIINQDDPAQINELEYFLQRIKRADGKFVIIPDDAFKMIYYVHLQNISAFANQIVRSSTKEWKSWKLELRSLTEGVRLVG